MTSAFRDGLLAGKTAFVAGGTSGINLGIAKRLAELGFRFEHPDLPEALRSLLTLRAPLAIATMQSPA